MKGTGSMKISEIKAQLKVAAAAPIEKNGTSEWWNLLPRIPFPELPDRYKQLVRERFTADNIRAFLIECYSSPDFEKAVASMTTAEREILPQPADSYVSFETMAADIPDNMLDKIIIKARNSAIYTIEALDEPMLYGDHACAAFENALDEYREASDKSTEKQTRRTVQKAAELSKFVSAGYYQLNISDPQYKHSLTTQKNKTAYIAIVDPAAFDGLTIADGFLRLDNDIMGRIKRYTKGKYEDISEIDLPLLVQCYTAAFKSIHSYGEHTVTVYQPQFFKEMGIDTHGEKSADMMRKIAAFSDLWGFLGHDGTMAKVFDLIQIDPQKQTMTFAAPYMLRIWEKLDEKNHIERNTKQGALISYDRPYHNNLVHSTIASERNKPAVELVYLITSGILQRGFIPDAKTYNRKQTRNISQGTITYSVTFRTLLNNAPLLRSRIATYKNTADKNRALRRAFEKAYSLLKTKTDAQQYFYNLKWQDAIPTMTTLDGVLTFTHEGKNGQYKRHI